MEKYRITTRNKWNFRLFKKDNEALPLNEKEEHQNKVLNYVMEQDTFNTYDARFLRKVGFGVYYIKGETDKRRNKFKEVSLFIWEDYCITPDFSWRWLTWDVNSGIDKDGLTAIMKNFADKYFFDAREADLSLKILHGDTRREKLNFKSKVAEQNFIKSMKDIIKKTQLMDYPTLAKRIIRSTNTELTEQKIIDVINNYRI